KGHHLLALHAVILRAGDRLLEEANDPVPSALGERTKVPLLALARLIIGADAAVDGDLSLNRPPKNDSRFDTANTGVPRAQIVNKDSRSARLSLSWTRHRGTANSCGLLFPSPASSSRRESSCRPSSANMRAVTPQMAQIDSARVQGKHDR